MDLKEFKILILEADPEAAQAIKEAVLKKAPADAVAMTASSLKEAVELATNEFPNVVLAGPESGGRIRLEVIRRLKDRVRAWSPIIAILEAADQEVELEVVSAGAQDSVLREKLLAGDGYNTVLIAIERLKQIEKMRAVWKTMIERAVDPVMVIDMKGIVRFVNQSMGKMLDKSEKELIGELIGIPLMCGDTMEVDLITSEGETTTVEMCLQRSEWEGDAAAVATMKKGLSYFNAVEEDKIAEETSGLLGDMGEDFMYEVSLGEEGRRRLGLNAALLTEITGYDEAEVPEQGSLLAFLTHPEDKELAVELTESAWQGKEGAREIRIVTKTKEERSVTVRKVPIMDSLEGRVSKVLTSIREVPPPKQK